MFDKIKNADRVLKNPLVFVVGTKENSTKFLVLDLEKRVVMTGDRKSTALPDYVFDSWANNVENFNEYLKNIKGDFYTAINEGAI